jgi:hypothetical protein
METCAYCKIQQTELYQHNVPICLNCAAIQEEKERSKSVHTSLVDALREATKEASSANREFNDVLEMPTGLPAPDGSLQIAHSSRKLGDARDELMTAHKRLDEFLSRGTVPEDLK